jgi:hypothetical protein
MNRIDLLPHLDQHDNKHAAPRHDRIPVVLHPDTFTKRKSPCFQGAFDLVRLVSDYELVAVQGFEPRT